MLKKITLNFCFFLFLCSSICSAAPIKGDIDSYISQNWQNLYRSISFCDAYKDSKVKGRYALYLPYKFPINKEILAIKQKCHVEIRYLPRVIHQVGDVRTTEINPHGLLYLPRPYVVPGGMFNEMYGWDSYFIILGLIKSNKITLAEDILENYDFEIRNYGAVLNANRTYHLSRSQPPFFTSAILAVYNAKQDKSKQWLSRFYSSAIQEYRQWTKAPFLAGSTSLSRYYDNEVTTLVEAKSYPYFYKKVLDYFKNHPSEAQGNFDNFALTSKFYQGERSLRASGFDITHRFGPFGSDTQFYIPVCLNSLLYKTEIDLAHMARIIGKPYEERHWLKLANTRKIAMNKYLYNSKKGIFVDYNFIKHQQSSYNYITTYYPLWAKLVTNKQAKELVNKLPIFEYENGLSMSDVESGVQWDKPFGWAPIHILVVQGLYNYGYESDGKRLAAKFNRMVKNNFDRTGHIYEKYNVITGESKLKFLGYKGNVIGFGWTNAGYLLFEDLLNKP